MTAFPTDGHIDGYRWLKNDIIRGTYQPDEKTADEFINRPSLRAWRRLLREALSQLRRNGWSPW